MYIRTQRALAVGVSEPLELVIGCDVVPVFADNNFVDKIVGVRVELAKESILMPIVRIRDHSRLHSKEVMILAYQNVLYNEELDVADENTLDYIIQRLRETVRSKYAEILTVDMVKDLIDSVKITYPTLVEGIVPDKLSYGLVLDVTRGFLERGNGMVYFPRILEFLECEVRESANTSVTGYMIDGETIEEAVAREVMEETGQEVLKSRYISSYYFEPKQLIMIGFIAYVKKKEFGNSEEVDDLKWFKIEEVDAVIARENNCSGMHFDACRKYLEYPER